MDIPLDKQRYDFEDLIAIMARLRAPDGCPWDREQTIESLRPFLLEEVYELLQAIDEGDVAAHREELGDVLLQIVFQSQIASEQGRFDARDVVDTIARKLLRRHPHVFGDETARTAGDVVVKWERVKAAEKKESEDPAGAAPASVLDGLPRALPALLEANRLSVRAARVGFDWESPAQVLDKLREELGELERALEGDEGVERAGWEIGDLLFAASNLARHLNRDAEDLLRAANRRFERRFRLVEQMAAARDIDLRTATIDRLEALWREAKESIDHRPPGT